MWRDGGGMEGYVMCGGMVEGWRGMRCVEGWWRDGGVCDVWRDGGGMEGYVMCGGMEGYVMCE